MTRDEFIKQEAKTSRDLMNRYAKEDFSLPPGSVSYSREYKCWCGFKTSDAGEIYDHAKTCSGETKK